ncbi:MAG: hypothetical protein ACK56I_21185, partial [bacterium]
LVVVAVRTGPGAGLDSPGVDIDLAGQSFFLHRDRVVDQPLGDLDAGAIQPRHDERRRQSASCHALGVVERIGDPAQDRMVHPVHEREFAVEAGGGLILLPQLGLLG